MKLKDIIALKTHDVSALYARGVVGDDEAMTDYVRWCVWRSIDQKEGLKKGGQGKSLRFICRMYHDGGGPWLNKNLN
jgi:hypothetical protein